jgi:hypothetical protein
MYLGLRPQLGACPKLQVKISFSREDTVIDGPLGHGIGCAPARAEIEHSSTDRELALVSGFNFSEEL